MLIKSLVICVYAATILFIGAKGLKRTASFNDFFLGGGRVGPWMSAFSYGTAYFSAVLFIGFAGKIGWGFGMSGLWIALFNAVVGVAAVWLLVGWKIKEMSTRYQVSTISEFLEKRYQSPPFKLLSALVIFIFLIPYSAAVFMGLSYLFEISLGVPYAWALIFIGGFTAAYIMLGGYKAMAMLDVIFGMIMTVGVVLLFYFTTSQGGGTINILEKLAAIEPKLAGPMGPPGFWPLFSLVFLTSVAPFAMPQLVQKFYAIRDKKAVKTGAVASTFFALLIGTVAYFIGACTRIFISPESSPAVFTDAAGALGTRPNFDMLMPELLTRMIPESLSVVILLLILSASMSTLASLVLISSSSFAKDFYAGFINPRVSDRKLTMIMRGMSGVFVLLAVMMAAVEIDVIVEILGISWGAIGAFFLGPFIWGLFSAKVNRLGALISALSGLGICLFLYFTGTSSPQAGTIGMMVSLAANPLASFIVNLAARQKEVQSSSKKNTVHGV